jgi:Domain of unknown function (DUF4160)
MAQSQLHRIYRRRSQLPATGRLVFNAALPSAILPLRCNPHSRSSQLLRGLVQPRFIPLANCSPPYMKLDCLQPLGIKRYTLCGPRIGLVMPEVSRFFGIIIRMFVEAGGQHHMPHFHAYYQEHVGIYDISKIERLAGSLPRRQERLVLAWAELHQEELLSNWQTLQQGRPPIKIEPLK